MSAGFMSLDRLYCYVGSGQVNPSVHTQRQRDRDIVVEGIYLSRPGEASPDSWETGTGSDNGSRSSVKSVETG